MYHEGGSEGGMVKDEFMLLRLNLKGNQHSGCFQEILILLSGHRVLEKNNCFLSKSEDIATCAVGSTDS
jgi:hypothetical protein